LRLHAYDRKFAEYLERSKARWLKQEAQLGSRHADYDSFLKSVPSAKRADVENRTTIRAWSAASGPFLEALCLLADVAKTTSGRTVKPVPTLQLFVHMGRSRCSWLASANLSGCRLLSWLVEVA
jgi:hypothetical protein